MRKALIATVSAAAALTLGAAALTAPSNGDELLKDERHFLEQSNKTFSGGSKAGSARNMVVVGKNDLGLRGFNADVWAHEGYAYVGQWGFQDWTNGSKARFCPSGDRAGVAVLDARDPANPTVVSRLLNPAGTSAEDVVVYTAPYGPLAGRDIAAVGIQVCGGSRYDESFRRGIQLFDVTNPAAPVEVGFFGSGCCTRGVHELEFAHRADLGRTFVYASVPTSEYDDALSPSGRRDRQGRGDFRLVDVTDPAAPVEVSNWGVLRNLGAAPTPGQGCDADGVYGHSAMPSHDGKLAFVSYWDSGFIALDVTNPANPKFKGRTVYEPDEDFCKTSGPGIETGYGYLRIYDYSNLKAPVQIGEFRTQNSLGLGAQGSGDYTIHNAFVHGTDVYISWYSDGIRVVDASNPRAPREVAHFVPPAGQNTVKPSQRGTLSNTTQVWGVYVDEATGLVYASDMNTGLWILRRTG